MPSGRCGGGGWSERPATSRAATRCSWREPSRRPCVRPCALQAPLKHAREEDEGREEDDQDAADRRGDLVVGLTPESLAAVVRERCGREHEQREHDRRRDERRAPHGRALYRSRPPHTINGMAVAIASNLGKDIAGAPLLRGVSFKLERRERLTIAGRNGAGKTTLLRMLAGEAALDVGELAIAKDVRVVLHDQRPPRERGVALRDYLLSGCAHRARDRGAPGEARDRDGRRRRRPGDARPLRARPGRARAPRRVPLARPRDRDRRGASAFTTRTSSAASRPSPAAS